MVLFYVLMILGEEWKVRSIKYTKGQTEMEAGEKLSHIIRMNKETFVQGWGGGLAGIKRLRLNFSLK